MSYSQLLPCPHTSAPFEFVGETCHIVLRYCHFLPSLLHSSTLLLHFSSAANPDYDGTRPYSRQMLQWNWIGGGEYSYVRYGGWVDDNQEETGIEIGSPRRNAYEWMNKWRNIHSRYLSLGSSSSSTISRRTEVEARMVLISKDTSVIYGRVIPFARENLWPPRMRRTTDATAAAVGAGSVHCE